MSLPDGVERDYPLARLTTVRAGGPADLFARVGDEAGLIAVLAHAEADPVGRHLAHHVLVVLQRVEGLKQRGYDPVCMSQNGMVPPFYFVFVFRVLFVFLKCYM